MTYATAYDDVMPSGRLRRSPRGAVPILPALAGLVGSALVAVLVLDVDGGVAPVQPGPSRPDVAAAPIASILGTDLSVVLTAQPLGQGAPLSAAFVAAPEPVVADAGEPAEQVVAEAPAPTPLVPPESEDAVLPSAPPVSPLIAAEVPLPVPRPTGLFERASPGPARPPSRMAARAAPDAPPPDNRSMFEKLFGLSSQPSGPALAYAAPEDGVISRMVRSSVAVTPDRQTAVYDISAHTVYLPDGTQLEAHSGLGSLLDDPRSMATRNRGVTPPSTYDLTLREKLFHGVRALRLTPAGNDRVFGRVGLLAHTFMLGPNGDSNGCVSFRNYEAFLQAYLSGQVKRLSVVARRG